MAERIGVGDRAPEFSLRTQTGEILNLRDLLGRKEIVLYFYPKDNTPGCTAEAGAFRDRYEAFRDLGAEVIGVSSDSVDSHHSFASKCDLPFTILSDERGRVRKLYGVPSTLGLLPGRVTYIIDTRGVVRHVFNSQTNPTKHVEEAIRILNEIRGEPHTTGSWDAGVAPIEAWRPRRTPGARTSAFFRRFLHASSTRSSSERLPSCL